MLFEAVTALPSISHDQLMRNAVRIVRCYLFCSCATEPSARDADDHFGEDITAAVCVDGERFEG